MTYRWRVDQVEASSNHTVRSVDIFKSLKRAQNRADLLNVTEDYIDGKRYFYEVREEIW